MRSDLAGVILDWTGAVLRFVFGHLFTALKGWPPILSLALISLVSGVAMLWVFGRISNQEAIGRAKRRLVASLYELRLFADEPALVWRAQKELVAANLRYLALVFQPAVVLTVPMIVLLFQLESFYGLLPLPVNVPAIVSVQMKGDVSGVRPQLLAPDGVTVETPPLRVPWEHRIYWRIRPKRELEGALRIQWTDGAIEKAVACGTTHRYLARRRVSSLFDQFLYPAEKRLHRGPVGWVEIRYPTTEISCLGIRSHWLVWFLLISIGSAWLLRKRFRVVM